MVAHQKAGTEPQSARRMGLISLVLSGIGIITFIIVVIVLVVLWAAALKNSYDKFKEDVKKVRHFVTRVSLQSQQAVSFQLHLMRLSNSLHCVSKKGPRHYRL